MTAILLAEAGIDVQVIDQAKGPATHAWACGLHPRSHKILARAGVLDDVTTEGHPINGVAFYEGATMVAETAFADGTSNVTHATAIPQSALEQILVRRFNDLRKDGVLWNHRLSKLEPTADHVSVSLDMLELAAEGYGVPNASVNVGEQRECSANYVIGADGRDSIVRHSLDLEGAAMGNSALYGFVDTEVGAPLGDRLHVMLSPDGPHAMWPLGGNQCRWIFRYGCGTGTEEVPRKERKSIEMPEASEAVTHFQQFITKRAPWFKHPIRNISWRTERPFEPWLCRRLGRDRCWLAGDAAHESAPIGMQSLNAGLMDAAELAEQLRLLLREQAPSTMLESYNRARCDEWDRLLKIHRTTHPGENAVFGLDSHWKDIPTCLPALGDDLEHMMSCLGAEVGAVHS